MSIDERTAVVARVEQQLPRRLPEAYRSWLLKGDNHRFAPFSLADADAWEGTVKAFLREWHPLNGALFPVHYGGDGLVVCLHLSAGDCDHAEAPVVAWAAADDLSEQSFVTLAADWDQYRLKCQDATASADATPCCALTADQRRELSAAAASRRALAARERGDSLAVFDRAVDAFHRRYSTDHPGHPFEHHADNATLDAEDWKPERLAVQDHLLGVMAYRYDARDNIVEAAGFATRDHTNFARGSATAGLLVALLCEWASRGACGICFRAEAGSARRRRPKADGDRVPYEVALLGWLLGARIRPGQEVLAAAAAARLFLGLTPFPPAVRRLLRDRPSVTIARACLMVYRQIWSPLEIVLLETCCPNVEELLGGTVDVGEQVRYQALLAHARAATLVRFGQCVITAAAPEEAPSAISFEIPVGQPALPYAAVFEPEHPTRWRMAGDAGGGTLELGPDRPVVLMGIPSADALNSLVRGHQPRSWLAGFLQGLPAEAMLLVIVPNRTPVPVGLADANGESRFRIVYADEDTAALDEGVQRRLADTRRLRR